MQKLVFLRPLLAVALVFNSAAGWAAPSSKGAAAPATEPEQPRLAIDGSCKITCNGHKDCRIPELDEHFCDFGSENADFVKQINEIDNQKGQLEVIGRHNTQVKKEYARFVQRRDALLAANDPKTIDKAQDPRSKKATLRSMKTDIENKRSDIEFPFVYRSQKGRDRLYKEKFDARLAEIKRELGSTEKDAKKKDAADKKKYADIAADEKGHVGAVKATVGKLKDGSVQNKAGKLDSMYTGDTRGTAARSPGKPGSTMAPQLGGSAAMTAGTMRGPVSNRYNGNIKEMDPGDHRLSTKPPAGAPEKPKEDNAWVKRVKEGEAAVQDAGTDSFVKAYGHSHQADTKKAAQDRAASAEWEKGNRLAAAKEKIKGWGSYAYHTGAQAGYTTKAVGLAVTEGVMNVARGEETAVKKVAIGGAVIATIVTAGAAAPAVAAAGGVGATSVAVAGAGLKVGGAAITTYTIADGTGGVARAENKTDAAKSGATVVAAVVAPKVVTGALGYGAKAAVSSAKYVAKGAEMVGLSGPLSKAGTFIASKGSAIAEYTGASKAAAWATAKLAGKAESAAVQVAAHNAAHGAAHSTAAGAVHVAKHTGKHVVEHEFIHVAPHAVEHVSHVAQGVGRAHTTPNH